MVSGMSLYYRFGNQNGRLHKLNAFHEHLFLTLSSLFLNLNLNRFPLFFLSSFFFSRYLFSFFPFFLLSRKHSYLHPHPHPHPQLCFHTHFSLPFPSQPDILYLSCTPIYTLHLPLQQSPLLQHSTTSTSSRLFLSSFSLVYDPLFLPHLHATP
ncbi:hypothetical protein BC939DRAFT_271106 [Gamsiella multidivaricata]|uniref:uncharacterized protein n=1 Tax=Gamsiella multidivaricata TaxID=101098 RepID=UPI00222106C0|nr:uncharacterized protein BC939DRAFT_271106 [Gamsiella multidivaricata]KAI7819048.1 hypothetical protein BC939DRAFT_271106 [Gamsiella multidivaricata]